MLRLEDKWRRRFEADAKECEHSERREILRSRKQTTASLSEATSMRSRVQPASALGQGKEKGEGAEAPAQGTVRATWQEIEIAFTSDERVQIRNSAKIETRNYGEFGFEDRRSGKPKQAWAALRELAERDGLIRRPTQLSKKWPLVERRMQEIRKILRAHFGIKSDPIPFVEGTGYQAVFKIGCRPSYHS